MNIFRFGAIARARAYSYLFHTLKQTDNNLGSYETQTETEIQNKI